MRLFLILLVCCMPTVSASDYHIAADGDDSRGDGSRQAPWASLAKVNGIALQPGDRLLLRGGDRFAGSLLLRAEDAGTAAQPVVITSYGDGRAIILPAATEHGIDIHNAAGFRISELIIDGGDLSQHQQCGIQLYVDLAGDDTRLAYISVSDCEIRNVHQGVSIGAWGAEESYSGFNDVTLERLVVHDIEHDGISSYGRYPGSATRQSHRNIVIRDCEVYGCTGDPERLDGHSGSGIILSGVIGGLIERCYAHHNGGGGGRPSGGGPVGIWCWDAVDVTIRRCLVHDQQTMRGAVDGGGFDLDGGAVGCTIEYCYSYDNQGPGILVAEFPGAPPLRDCTVRYNVSFNDGQANRMGAIHFWNDKPDADLCAAITMHNNLIVLGPDSTGPVIRYQSGGMRDLRFHNNIFVTQRGLELVQIARRTDAFHFAGNAWFALDGQYRYRWGETTADSLQAWAALRQVGAETGRQGDPGLVDVVSMARPTSIAALDSLEAIRLAAETTGPGAGVDLQATLGIDPGPRDFFGRSLDGSGPAIGIEARPSR